MDIQWSVNGQNNPVTMESLCRVIKRYGFETQCGVTVTKGQKQVMTNLIFLDHQMKKI